MPGVFGLRSQRSQTLKTCKVWRIGRYYTSNYLQLPGSRLSSLLAPPGLRSRSIARIPARGINCVGYPIPARSHRRKYKFRNIKPRSQPLRGRPSPARRTIWGRRAFRNAGTEIFIRNTRTKKSKGEEDDDSRVSRRLQGPRLEAGSRAHLVVV